MQAQAELDSDLPIQVAKGTPWEFEAVLNNAACRGKVCKASIAAGGLHMLGLSARRLMDLWERLSQT